MDGVQGLLQLSTVCALLADFEKTPREMGVLQ